MPNIILPNPPPERKSNFFDELKRAIEEGFRRCIGREEAPSTIYLTSPNNTVYAVSVEDDGSLKASPFKLTETNPAKAGSRKRR